MATMFPTTNIPSLGNVKGIVEDGNIHVYKKIPFAEKPVPRFHPPIPISKWAGTLDCTSDGAICFSAHDNGDTSVLKPGTMPSDSATFSEMMIKKLGFNKAEEDTYLKLLKSRRAIQKQDEDSLTLTIRTPINSNNNNNNNNNKLPVMVWIHGGDHQSGSGSSPNYSINTLPKMYNIVQVSINYRLGIFGYL